jgi:hypothetical protein
MTSKHHKIQCEPYGGIGNRLLTIASAYRISKLIGNSFELGWRAMPTVLEQPIYDYFELPFATYLSHPGPIISTNPPSGHTRFYYSRSQLKGKDILIVSGNHLKHEFYHCIWLEDDLIDFSTKTQTRLTEEIRDSLTEILKPKPVLTSFISKSGCPERFSLGVHYRSPVPDDYEKGLDSAWPQLDFDLIAKQIAIVAIQTNSSEIYLSSPSRDIADLIGQELARRRIRTYTAQDYTLGSSQSQSFYAYFDFMMLTRCNNIFRRANTTFSAVASLCANALQYIVTDDYRFITMQPLLFSGAAL